MITWPIVAVTGHRSQHLDAGQRAWVRDTLARLAVLLRDNHGMTTGISGMALGADLWWAAALDRAGVQIEAHVPFPQQADKWPAKDRAEWERLCRTAHKVVTYGGYYDVRALHARNHGMIDRSNMLLAVWQPGRQGGTYRALRYAVEQGHRPTWIDPDRRTVTWPDRGEWRKLLAQPAIDSPQRRAGARKPADVYL